MSPNGAVLVALAMSMAACGSRASVEHPIASRSAPPPSTAKEYKASLAFARCMRAHGVPQPDPDKSGDIHLSPADERRMGRAGHAKVQAVDRLCFNRHLKGVVSTKPLSAEAHARAIAVLRQLSQCLHGFGYSMGRPVVRNLSEGRAFFGFEPTAPVADRDRKALGRAEHTCEQRVGLARKIDQIVRADRGPY